MIHLRKGSFLNVQIDNHCAIVSKTLFGVVVAEITLRNKLPFILHLRVYLLTSTLQSQILVVV